MTFFPRMFDPNPKPAGYSDYQQEEADIARRRALADALVNKGLFTERDNKGTMVGRRYIKPNAAGALQDVFSVYAGAQMGREAGEQAKDMRTRQQAATSSWMKDMVEGKTSQQPFIAPGIDAADSAQASQGMSQNVQRPMNKQELMAHYMKGMELGGPASAMSAKGLENLINQQTKAPNWKVEDRFNPDTGRPEKVWVDMNNPGGPVIPFGGQKGVDPTDASKRYGELKNMGLPDEVAKGIAYGYLKLGQNSDGSTVVVDLRQAAQEGGMGQGPTPGAPGQQPAVPPGQPPLTPPQPAQQPTAPQQPPVAPPQPPVVPTPQPATQSPYAPAARVPGQVGAAPPSGKGTQRLNDDTEKLGKEMQTQQIPTTLSGIREVNNLINKLDLKKNARTGRLATDIPGFGMTGGPFPNMLLSQEGKDLRGSVKSVANKLLQAQSGLAVTDQENKRFLDQLQQGVGMNDQDFLNGWDRVMEEVNAKLGNFKGGFHPEVIQEYSRRNPSITFGLTKPAILGGAAQQQDQQGANPAAQFFPR